MTPNVTLLMLTWNALENIKLTLDSLYRCTDNFDLLIWDNGSTQETREYLKTFASTHTNIEITYSKDNIGAWSGRLALANRANTNLICTLDSDLYFSKDWLVHLISGLKEVENAGQIGPLKLSQNVLHPYTGNTIKDTWNASFRMDSTLTENLNNFAGGKDFDTFVMDLVASRQTKGNVEKLVVPTRSVSTCTMLTYRDLFLDPSINDTKYGEIKWGLEDLDYSWSLAKAGYSVLKSNSTYVHHFEHSSLKSNKVKVISEKEIELLKYLLDKWNKELLELNEELTDAEVNTNEFFRLVLKLKPDLLPTSILAKMK